MASEGTGADWLRQHSADHALTNVRFVGFQPYENLPEVLATGDVLLVILERTAAAFSVPSKLLSYQCAGRPLLASVPPENLSSRIISSSNSGIVVPPDDHRGFVEAARRLVNDGVLRTEMGADARRYAEDTFDITSIGDAFESIIVGVGGTKDFRT